jgi:sec-independent protein translocase protein TatA
MEMVSDLFDSPWKLLIVAVVLIVLFGSKKLPDAARSVGKSLRILKTEVGSLHEDEPPAGTLATAQTAPVEESARLTAGPVTSGQQSQVEILQQQIRDLQRAATVDDTPARTAPGPQQT